MCIFTYTDVKNDGRNKANIFAAWYAVHVINLVSIWPKSTHNSPQAYCGKNTFFGITFLSNWKYLSRHVRTATTVNSLLTHLNLNSKLNYSTCYTMSNGGIDLLLRRGLTVIP
jgi:hypothetical protein